MGTSTSRANLKAALEVGRRQKDQLIIAGALDQLAYHSIFGHIGAEDRAEREELSRQALACAVEAKAAFARIGILDPRAEFMWAESPEADYYWARAYFTEGDPERRRDLLERAIASFPTLRRLTDECGYPLRQLVTRESIAEVLSLRARLEPNRAAKKRLLEEALLNKREAADLLDRLHPASVWGHGYVQNWLADIQAGLAELADAPEERQRLLREAIQTKEAAARQLSPGAPREPVEKFSSLYMLEGDARSDRGDWLVRLFEMTREADLLRVAREEFEKAASLFVRADHANRAAESRWKSGKALARLRDDRAASEAFRLASDLYRTAARRWPSLEAEYLDLAIYMEAWDKIEKAQEHHSIGRFSAAAECYEQAATLHRLSRRWSYMAQDYAAWASLEGAEDLSRREKISDAGGAFAAAEGLFAGAESELGGTLSQLRDPEERGMAEELLRAAETRKRYCRARRALEEARRLDRDGEYARCARGYGEAAASLAELASSVDSAEDRDELRLMAALAGAWEALARAEAGCSAEGYAEAARRFEAVSDLSPTEKAKALARGHGLYTQALGAARGSEEAADAALHASAVRNLSLAARHYAMAGAEGAAGFARASKLLLEGCAALDRVGRDSDPRKKAMGYLVAEKILESAAEAYETAGRPAKRDQVLRLLESVRRDREVARSVMSILRAPEMTGIASPFPTPGLTHERAVGLQGFQVARILARFKLSSASLVVGEELSIRIEFVNAGRRPASLARVDGLTAAGLELTTAPGADQPPLGILNLGAKRLDPLQRTEVVAVVRPTATGRFSLRPQLVYLDDEGQPRTVDLDRIEVTVADATRTARPH